MVQIIGKSFAESGSPSEQLRKLAEDAERRFQELPEEDQMLELIARQISFVFGNTHGDKEDLARWLIAHSHGPKFANRVLSTPALRWKIGLDRPQQATDASAATTTAVIHT